MQSVELMWTGPRHPNELIGQHHLAGGPRSGACLALQVAVLENGTVVVWGLALWLCSSRHEARGEDVRSGILEPLSMQVHARLCATRTTGSAIGSELRSVRGLPERGVPASAAATLAMLRSYPLVAVLFGGVRGCGAPHSCSLPVSIRQ